MLYESHSGCLCVSTSVKSYEWRHSVLPSKLFPPRCWSFRSSGSCLPLHPGSIRGETRARVPAPSWPTAQTHPSQPHSLPLRLVDVYFVLFFSPILSLCALPDLVCLYHCLTSNLLFFHFFLLSCFFPLPPSLSVFSPMFNDLMWWFCDCCFVMCCGAGVGLAVVFVIPMSWWWCLRLCCCLVGVTVSWLVLSVVVGVALQRKRGVPSGSLPANGKSQI